MDWSYGFDSKASNKKVADEEFEDFDEKGKPNEGGYGYPYEDGGVMSKPRAVVVDGGQRKSSITHYPNVDGSDSYVVRTERVVKVVRPVMTTHYSLKEDRDDNLGMAKSFLDQFLKEAAMSSAPVHQSRTYWGCRDESPLKYDEYSHQFSPPNMAKFPSWEETNDEHQELGRPRTGSRRNWSSRDESPPRFATHPRWNYPNHSGGRHDWPSQNDSPRRSMMHPELNHINSSSARPNWPSHDNSFPGPLVRHQLSQSNPGSTPNWTRQYDSPPRSMEYLEVGHSNSSAKPNWPSRYSSPPRSTGRFVSNHPNSRARSNWQAREDSPSRFMTHPESSYYPNSSTRPNWPSQYDSPRESMYLEPSHPNSGVRPNWSSRDDSPPRLIEYPSLTTHNVASTKPNWSSRVESPPRPMTHLTLNHPNSPSTKPSWPSHQEAGSPSPHNIENGRDNINTGLVLKKFDELNLQDSRGTSPLPNERSGSDASKTANYNGTSMDSGQRPNWPNRKGHSTYKTNKDDHEKPKFNGAQTKNTHDEEIPDIINNKKIATLHREDYKTSKYSDWPVEDEDEDDDSKKSGILRSSTNVSHKASETKPNYSSGSYNQPVSSTTNDEVSDIMKLVEEAKKTATYDPNEITLNPPQQMHYWDYYKPVLDSNEASRKYNGIYRRT
nr:adhesive plaque matrix protein-like isoform X3 [Ipomoea batatas]